MRNSITAGLRQGIGLRFFLATSLVMVVLILSVLEPLIKIYREFSILSYGYHLNLILDAMKSDTFMPFVAIVSVLPFSANYIDEIKSKFARYAMMRTGFGEYLVSKAVVCFLLGGMVVVTGVLLTYGFSSLVFLPLEKPSEGEGTQLTLLWERCLTLFLSGGMWSLLGMTMSTVMESKYIAYASPFVGYYLLVMLHERYFPDAYLIYPKQWLIPSQAWPFGIWGVTVFIMELSLILGFIFYIRGKRRLEQL